MLRLFPICLLLGLLTMLNGALPDAHTGSSETALFHRMSVDEVSELDLSYTPPLGSPWDAVQMATQAWVRQHIPAEPGTATLLTEPVPADAVSTEA